MKRLITKREEEAYRCRHHDFEGLTLSETARKMGISEKVVSNLLSSMKKKVPQLFPILSKRQVEVFESWLKGNAIEEIALDTGLAEQTIKNVLQTVKNKMGAKFPPHNTILSYHPSMDPYIKERF